MKTRTIAAALLSLGLATSAALAATPSASTAPVEGQRTVKAMFDFADANHDGRLTRAEARGHLPLTYDQFATIDTAGRGWIGFDEYVAFTNRRADQQTRAVFKVGDWR